MNRFKQIVNVLLASTLLLVASSAMADAEAEIKYRQSVLKSVGGHMGAFSAILRGGVHSEDFQFHADSMARLAKIVPTIFPPGSGEGKTDALPEIWEDSADFKEKVAAFVTAADNIASVAAGDDMRAKGGAVQQLGRSCKGCHDNYRHSD